MTFATRTTMTFLLALLLAVAGELSAQETATTAQTTAAPATATATTTTTAPNPESRDGERPAAAAGKEQTEGSAAEEKQAPSSREVRENLTALLQQYPPQVGQILRLDPTLLSDENFLRRYSQLQQFVAQHPEVRHHSTFYLSQLPEYQPTPPPYRPRNQVEETVETLLVFVMFGLTAITLGWLLRTVLDYKRLNRLQRAQAEVHNRIMERFGTTDELLQYIRTPAGTKYLEFQPIQLRAEAPRPPLTRAMWSVQIGIIVGAAALGMLILAGVFSGEGGQNFFAMGTIFLAVAVGFIGSAVVSIAMSRRFGLWQTPPPDDTPTFTDRGIVQ